MFLVKQMFRFGLSTVPQGKGRVYQIPRVSLTILYHLPDKSLQSRLTQPFTSRRSFVEQDQYAYDKYVLWPNGTLSFHGDKIFNLVRSKDLVCGGRDGLQDFRTFTNYSVHQYNLPPPTPAHEMQALRIILQEERQFKRTRVEKQQQEAVFIVPQPLEQSTPLQQELFIPQFQEEAASIQQRLLDPPCTEARDLTIFFKDPAPMDLDNSNNWTAILEGNILQETVNNFLSQFEKELCASSLGPAHQIHLDGPSWHSSPMTSPTQLPPSPDNYWVPNESVNDSELLVELNENTSQDLTSPWDLIRNDYVAIPRRTYALFPGSGPLDLTVQTVM